MNYHKQRIRMCIRQLARRKGCCYARMHTEFQKTQITNSQDKIARNNKDNLYLIAGNYREPMTFNMCYMQQLYHTTLLPKKNLYHTTPCQKNLDNFFSHFPLKSFPAWNGISLITHNILVTHIILMCEPKLSFDN